MTENEWRKANKEAIKKYGLFSLSVYDTKHVAEARFGRHYHDPRIDGPTKIGYHANGTIHYEIYIGDGGEHREDGPAMVYYHPNGQKECNWYRQNGIDHRLDGPSYIAYDNTGVVVRCEYKQWNTFHREDGPAYYCVGREKPEYYLHGVLVDKQIVMAPHTQTIRQINNDMNIERKRIRIERYGWLKFLHKMRPVVVDKQQNRIDGTNEVLLRCRSGELTVMILLCTCPSTARVYPIEVPSSTMNCFGAQDWLRGERLKNARIIGAS